MAEVVVWALGGRLQKDTVPTLWLEGQQRLRGGGELDIDLSAVEICDSAGVAVLVDWLRLAAIQGTRLRYRNAPAQVIAIADVSDLEQLLLGDAQRAVDPPAADR
jgi:phospholipid transport system transporter-binding protein